MPQSGPWKYAASPPPPPCPRHGLGYGGHGPHRPLFRIITVGMPSVSWTRGMLRTVLEVLYSSNAPIPTLAQPTPTPTLAQPTPSPYPCAARTRPLPLRSQHPAPTLAQPTPSPYPCAAHIVAFVPQTPGTAHTDAHVHLVLQCGSEGRLC